MSDHEKNPAAVDDVGEPEASGPRSKDGEDPPVEARSDTSEASGDERAPETASSTEPMAPTNPPSDPQPSDRITAPPNTEGFRAQERASSMPSDEPPAAAKNKGDTDVSVAPTIRPDPFRDWSDLDEPLPPPAAVPSTTAAAPRVRIPTGPKATGERRGGLGMFRSTAVTGTPSPALSPSVDNAPTEPPTASDTERPKSASTEAPETPRAPVAQGDDKPSPEGSASASASPTPAAPPVAGATAALRPAAAPTNTPPKERVVLQGPRGTALLGVPKPNAPVDAKGPRGTAVMGLARPAVKKAANGDLGSSFENESTTSASFTHLATTEKARMAQVVVGSMIGVLLAMGLGALLLFFVLGNRNPAQATGQPVVASESPDPAPAASSSPAPSASAPAPTGPDAIAIAALETLRRGVETCMKELKAMPGSAPAVPRSLAFLAKGPYRSAAREWSSPTYSCTKFKIEDPMPFALQWQYIPSEKAGRGVAWIDDNGDGAADRAYAFTAKVVGPQSAEFGKVGPIDPTTRIEKVFGY